MQLFFAENLESDFYELPTEESRHCVRVLRMGAGDTLWLTDGRGTLCRATIVAPHDKACSVEIVERIEHYQQRNHRLHIAVSPTKNMARMEWFIEKAVEIGIDEITPIICDHSERCVLKADRMEKIIISAMKQSLKAYKPTLNAPTPLHQLLSAPFDGIKMICHCEENQRTPLREAYRPGHNALILIGPEGDFSNDEITTALSMGYSPVTLGDCRLRTETAALYATTAINFMNC